MNLKLTLPDGSAAYDVIGYVTDDNRDYISNKGYIDANNDIWIFSPDGAMSVDCPYFTIEDDKIVYSRRTVKHNSIFKRRACVNLDVNDIIANIDLAVKEYEKQPIPIDYENGDDIKFNDTDTMLTLLIKHLLVETHVDLNALGSEIGETTNMNNLKSSLKRGDVSHKTFLKWCKYLGLNFSIILEDDPNERPLLGGDKLIYTSSNNTVSKISEKGGK